MTKKLEPGPETLEHFHMRWRMSEFYDYVIKVIETARDRKVLYDVLEQYLAEGKSASDDEIASMAKTDVQSSARINNDIYEILK